jgi:hypothetical protein
MLRLLARGDMRMLRVIWPAMRRMPFDLNGNDYPAGADRSTPHFLRSQRRVPAFFRIAAQFDMHLGAAGRWTSVADQLEDRFPGRPSVFRFLVVPSFIPFYTPAAPISGSFR